MAYSAIPMKRRDMLLASTAALLAHGQTGTKRSPNIVFFLADDLGYADLGCYGNSENRTPISTVWPPRASDSLIFMQPGLRVRPRVRQS